MMSHETKGAYRGPFTGLPDAADSEAERQAGFAQQRKVAHAVACHDDLVAALSDCVNAMYSDNPADGWLEIIQAGQSALAKAKGE